MTVFAASVDALAIVTGAGSPAEMTVEMAAFSVLPASLGSWMLAGPWPTKIVTVEPLSASVLEVGSCLTTSPLLSGGRLLRLVVTTNPFSWSVCCALAAVNPITSGTVT